MEKDEFDESWPAWKDGYLFADQDALEELKEPKAQSAWISIPLALICMICVYYMVGSDDPKIRTLALFITIGFVYNKVSEMHRTMRSLRREVELLKGSVRLNRFLSQRKSGEYH